MNSSDIYMLLQLLYVIVILGTVIVVISQNRNTLKTISWVVVLLMLPILGFVIYYLFGEDHRRKRLISKKMYKKINHKSLEQLQMPESLVPPLEYEGLTTLLNRMKESPLYDGNTVTFYNNGKEKFEALFDEIKKAKHHIHIQYYIYMDDVIGTELKELLIEKAKEGIEIRLSFDDVGSWKVKDRFFREMEKHGIEVQPFLKVRFPVLTNRVNYRNHRKIVVIDGTVGFMGGMNVADRYIDSYEKGIWRDSHIKIEGKAVHGLQTSFIIDWFLSRKQLLSSRVYFPQLSAHGDTMMQIVTSGPTGEYREIYQGIFYAISNAKKCINIQTPYFIPTDSLSLAIRSAALSGVDVRLMLPEVSDSRLVNIASQSYIRDMLKAGVKVYFFKAGFIHSKLITIDDSLTIIGSANMDVRSYELNFEVNAFIYDEKVAVDAVQIYEDDLKNSEQLVLEEWGKRSGFRKFLESVMRLFAPLL